MNIKNVYEKHRHIASESIWHGYLKNIFVFCVIIALNINSFWLS